MKVVKIFGMALLRSVGGLFLGALLGLAFPWLEAWEEWRKSA
jgi:hypothetical protein